MKISQEESVILEEKKNISQLNIFPADLHLQLLILCLKLDSFAAQAAQP